MLGTLTKNLFRRPQPDNDSEAHGSLDRNAVIEIVETVEGKMLDGISTWYKASDGFFYWGGGVKIVNGVSHEAVSAPAGALVFDQQKMSWAHTMFGILDIWKEGGSMGENVKIALLDTGIDSNTMEFDSIILKRNFIKDIPAENFHDLDGHGTQMAGIIAANGKSAFGIAPKSQLFIAKIDSGDVESIIEAVKWADDLKVDIISMSFERREEDQMLLDELRKCKTNGIALICAAGNGGQSGKVKDRFPASFDVCYSIGACNEQFKRLTISNLSNHLRMLSPGTNILTINTGGVSGIAESGSSIATAYTSGVVALLLSVKRKMNPQANAIEIVEQIINHTTVLPHMNNRLEYGNGVINPFQSFLNL